MRPRRFPGSYIGLWRRWALYSELDRPQISCPIKGTSAFSSWIEYTVCKGKNKHSNTYQSWLGKVVEVTALCYNLFSRQLSKGLLLIRQQSKNLKLEKYHKTLILFSKILLNFNLYFSYEKHLNNLHHHQILPLTTYKNTFLLEDLLRFSSITFELKRFDFLAIFSSRSKWNLNTLSVEISSVKSDEKIASWQNFLQRNIFSQRNFPPTNFLPIRGSITRFTCFINSKKDQYWSLNH